MGLNLRKLKDAVIAQVNTFDGGKTWKNPNPVKPQPAQTPPPSYGGGVRGVTNWARDRFDANTPQDFAKRNAQNKAFAGSKNYNLTYEQQQQQRPSFISAAMSSPLSPTNVLKTVANTVGQPVVANIDLVKAGVGQLTGNDQARNNALKAAQQKSTAAPKLVYNTFINPSIKGAQAIGENAATAFSGDARNAEQAQTNLVDQLEVQKLDAIKRAKQGFQTQGQIDQFNKYADNLWNDAGQARFDQMNAQQEKYQKIDPTKNAALIADAGLTALSFGVAGVTKQGMKAAATKATEKALAKGLSKDVAMGIGGKAARNNFISNTVSTGVLGASQGAVSPYAVQAPGTVKGSDVLRGALMGGTLGAAMPAAFVKMGGGKINLRPQTRATTKEATTLSNLLNNRGGFMKNGVYEDGMAVANKYGIDLGTPDGIQQAQGIVDASRHFQNQPVKSRFGLTKMNQGGYVKNPLGKDPPVESKGAQVGKTEGVAPTGNTLDEPFKHPSWYKKQKLTKREALDKIAEEDNIFLDKQYADESLQPANPFAPGIYDDVLSDGRKNSKVWQLTPEEKKYYELKRAEHNVTRRQEALDRANEWKQTEYLPIAEMELKKAKQRLSELSPESDLTKSTPPKTVAPKSAPIDTTPQVDKTVDAPKPVVKTAPVAKPVVKSAQPTKPNVVKSVKPEKPVVTAKSAPVDVDAQLEKEIFGTMAGTNYKQSTLGTLGEKLSPNRQIRKVTQAVDRGINKGLRASLESGNRVGRTPGRTVVGVSRQAGRTGEELAQYGKLQGSKQIGDELGMKIAQSGDEAIKRGVDPTKVADALDPALTKARGGKAPTLTKLEQAEVDRLRRIIDLTHEGEHNIGILSDKAYEANKGTYFPRNFDDFFDNSTTRQIAKDNKLDLNIFKNRKDLADIPAEVLEKANRDPYYMTALRTQQYAKNKAVVDHTKWLAKSGSVIDAPKKGYVQVPDSPAYGAIKGKYVLKEQLEDLQGFIYETDTAQHVVALLNTFDRNPARQFLKKTKTVYNPGVRLGNRIFNYLTAGINGINPITYTKNWARASKMMGKKSPEFLEATRAGVFGSSIIDKELYQVGDALTPVKGNTAAKAVRGADNAITNTYRGVDDKGKLATYLTFRERGVSVAEAAERTRKAMQNYDMVGHFFDLGAKTPVGGNAFVRFSSELTRIAYNAAVDNPLRLAGAMASVVALTTLASKLSGESDEDRKTREGRLGAAKVPFTNQSLEVQTPYGAINIGRLLGVTTYNDINGGVAEDAKRLLPFQPPVTNTSNGVKFNPNFLTADPLVGGIMGQIIDKDFRGKSIKDPENSGQFLDQLSTKDQVINRAKVAAMSYVPLANEANSLISSARGKENFYGKERSLPQSLLRTVGVKVEQYGPDQAKKQRSTNEYFKEKDALDKEIATLPKKDQEAYKQATGYYKLREQVPNEFDPGKTRYKKAPVYNFSENKWGEYASSPELYDKIAAYKQKQHDKSVEANAKDPTQKVVPLQPEFDKTLSSEFRKQLISNKALAPGEDVEADQRMYMSSEWDTYSKLKDKYTAGAKKYYPQNDKENFVDEMVKHQNAPFPEKGAAKKAYDEAYSLYAQGKGPKPAYTDAVDADKEAYSTAKFNWTNTERKARGLPPISKETWDNVTFGFQSDEEKVYKELKYGKGLGGYSKYGYSRSGGSGGGGSSSKTGLNSDAPNLYKYAISSGASTAKPTVKKAAGVAKVGVAMKTKTAKPKVTIKKSKA